MKLATEILKELLLPILEKNSQFDVSKISESFLQSFVNALCNFEKDKNSTFQLLSDLNLEDINSTTSKLDSLYIEFIKELAENYVLGHSSEITKTLLETQNTTFSKYLKFFTDLENAIKHFERKRIKQELPNSFEKLTFEINDEMITNAIKKKSREDLKKKMVGWDEELLTEYVPVIPLDVEKVSNENSSSNHRKVINLTWVKYAVAACFILAGGIWFFKQSNPDLPEVENNVVNTDTTSIIQPKNKQAPVEVVAENTKILEKQVQYPSDLGFTNTNSTKIITLYLKEISKNNLKESTYEFDGNRLTIYVKDFKGKYAILSLDNKVYYVKMKDQYYQLYLTKIPLKFKLVEDQDLIEQLNKTSFDNEE